ncbi:hypothetical protein LJB99_01950 [Deltaproteobacteria bacterium OttesenSCG-928-K17]|nr:hypothetical protein [Deltaproteobacteria bacterium OttesenSCG-928-K17]
MHDIYMAEVLDDFRRCYNAAGCHLQSQVQEGIFWIKAIPTPPFLEHLSFRLANQLFFIHIYDVDGGFETPGTPEGLNRIAFETKGQPCLMPMKRQAGKWVAVENGWGLVHAVTGQPVNPVDLVTDELIQMTDWEVHDLAVQIVRDSLKGRQIMSWCSDIEIQPSIWFVGDYGPEWIIVQALRYPAKSAPPPENLKDILKKCSRLSNRGHLARVGVAASDQRDNSAPLPLYRGHCLNIQYTGMTPLFTQAS